MTPLDFLNLLWQAKPEDLHILIWTLRNKKSHWFRDITAAAKFVESVFGADVYVGVGLASRDYGPHYRCVSDQIAGLAGLAADLDLKSEAHNKPLPATIEEALTILPAALPPTIIISTGNGLHVWWLFKQPWIFENDEERTQAATLSSRFQTLLRYNASQHGWAFERLSDLARILRIPGTVNAKDAANPKNITVLGPTGPRYNPADFERFLNEQAIPDPEAEAHAAKQFAERFTNHPLKFNRDAAIPDDMLARWMEQDARFRRTWNRQRDDLNDQSGSGYDMALACFGVGVGLSDQQIVDLIVHHRRIHGEQQRTALDYFQRTISKARKNAEGVQALQSSADARSLCLDAVSGASGKCDGPNEKARLCQQLSVILGVQILRLVKVSGEEPVFFMDLEQGRIQIPNIGKLVSLTFVRNAIAGKVGKLIKIKPKQWDQQLAQMILDACVVQECTDDLELEGKARMYIGQYLADVPFIASPGGQSVADRYRPMVEDGRILLSARDMQVYLNRNAEEKLSVKAVGAMAAVIGAKAVRVRGQGFREQSRWALPVKEFDPNDYGQNVSGSENRVD